MIPSLPSYSSTSTPSYSSEPSFDELSLDQTPAIGRLPTPTGTYTKTDDNFTLTLIEQTCGVVLPTYGRNGLVKGTISLRECSEVVAVNIKVSGAVCVPTSHASCEHKLSQIDGRLNVEIADGGMARTTFLTA